jgi:DNA-binding beta-propeller fold protein YncE
LSKTSSAKGLVRQPTRWTRKRLFVAIGAIFVAGIVAAALNLEFVIGGAPRKVQSNSLLVLDPQTMRTVVNVRRPGPRPPELVRGAGLVWTVDGERDRLIATNPVSKRVFRNQVVGTDPVAVGIGFGAAWVANAGNGSVTRVPLDGSTVETIGLDDEPSAIATGAGYVWVLSERSRKVIRIDPETKQVTKTVRLTNPPLAVRAPRRVNVAIGD